MTFNQIKYFITVAECLSFTEAAKRLFITQPALSRQISAIEEELKTPLFLRDKKRLKLTPGGMVLYSKFPKLQEEYNEIIEEAQNANKGYKGFLRMGILDVYDVNDRLSAVLEAFERKYPDIHLTLERFSLGNLPEKLYEGHLDLIVTYGFSLFDKPGLLVQKFHKFRSCIMLPRKHPLLEKKNLTLYDLRDETFASLRPQESEEGYNYIINLCHKYNFHPKLKLVESNGSVLLWVEMGSCVAISSDSTIEKNNPAVTFVSIPDLEEHDMVISWKKSNYNLAIPIFLELIQ